MTNGNAPEPSRFGQRLLILCAIAALALFLYASFFAPRGGDQDEAIDIGRYGLILIVVALSIAASRRRLTVIAAELTAWLLVMLVLVAGYSYRGELADLGRRVAAELAPARGTETAPGVMSFVRSRDGQFWINAEVNGRSVRFLVDTGSTGVVLSRADALRLGFTPDRLSFTEEVDTANGRTAEAPIVLDALRIGSIRFDRVPASVSSGALRDSLLGMHLLAQLSSVEIRKDSLTIRQ